MFLDVSGDNGLLHNAGQFFESLFYQVVKFFVVAHIMYLPTNDVLRDLHRLTVLQGGHYEPARRWPPGPGRARAAGAAALGVSFACSSSFIISLSASPYFSLKFC